MGVQKREGALGRPNSYIPISPVYEEYSQYGATTTVGSRILYIAPASVYLHRERVFSELVNAIKTAQQEVDIQDARPLSGPLLLPKYIY